MENARDISFNTCIGSEQRSHILFDRLLPAFFDFLIERNVFKRALEMKDEIDVKLYADYPREIQGRRRKLKPRLKLAREEGK